jgi:hypothetical protein
MLGYLIDVLNARQLDLAVQFDTSVVRRWSLMPLLEEKLYLMRARPQARPACRLPPAWRMLQDVPLMLVSDITRPCVMSMLRRICPASTSSPARMSLVFVGVNTMGAVSTRLKSKFQVSR